MFSQCRLVVYYHWNEGKAGHSYRSCPAAPGEARTLPEWLGCLVQRLLGPGRQILLEVYHELG